jgi:hypothetical protein
MSIIRLRGMLGIGPICACDGDVFPGATAQVSLETTPCQKSSQVDSGIQKRNLNSPGGYVTLTGVGSSDTVTQGDTLYVRTQSPCLIRVTFFNPVVPMSPIVSIIPLQGTMFIEPPASYYVSLLEAQGVGFVEYLVSGQL